MDIETISNATGRLRVRAENIAKQTGEYEPDLVDRDRRYEVAFLSNVADQIERLSRPVGPSEGPQFSRTCSCQMCRSYFNSTPTF